MSRKPKSKVSTEHENTRLVVNPFAEMSIGNLPENPDPISESALVVETETQSKGRVDVVREKSGRAGKTVTVLRGFSETISLQELDAVAFKLKKHCACGGSLKKRTIELQGDVCSQAMRELEKLKFRPVRSGG